MTRTNTAIAALLAALAMPQACSQTADATVKVAALAAPEAMTLDQAIGLALKNNETIGIAETSLERAKARVREAKAPAYPQVSVSGRVLAQKETEIPAGVFGPDAVTLTPATAQDAAASFSQFIDVFGLVSRAKKVATLSESLEALNVARSKSEVIYQTRAGYYNVLRAWGAVDVARSSLKTSEEQSRQAQAFEKAGVAPKFDVMQADVAVASRKQVLIAAEDSLRVAGGYLNAVIGLPVETPVNISQVESSPDRNVDIDTQTRAALANRPELVQLSLGIDISNELSELERRGTYPTVALSGSYGYNAAGGGFSTDNSSWNAGVVAQWPFLDGGKAKARADQSKQDARATTLRKSQAERSIALEVRTAGLKVQESADRFAVAAQSVETAREALRLSQARYSNGVTTQLEVINAQASVLLAEYQRNNALYDYFLARTDFDASVTGRLSTSAANFSTSQSLSLGVASATSGVGSAAP